MNGQLEPAFRAVLFDWRGTLVVAPTDRWMVKTALEGLHREATSAAVDEVLRVLSRGDKSRVNSSLIDTDVHEHRAAYADWFASVGVDAHLSDALYKTESDALSNAFASNVGEIFEALTAAGVRIGVVSDIHVDIRPAFASHTTADGRTWADLVELWALSYELGVAKPDPRIFRYALDRLNLPARDVLMVGDRAAWDGEAVALGIVTLLLPPIVAVTDSRLHLVLDLVLPNRG